MSGFKYAFYCLCCLALMPRIGIAAPSNAEENFTKSRITPYEPGYMVWKMRDHDEDALNVHYSLRYNLLPNNPNNPKLTYFARGYDIFASYTGEFDFYAGTRDSDPVVNRLNNPAIHFRVYGLSYNEKSDSYEQKRNPLSRAIWIDESSLKSLFGLHLYWLDLAIQHKSNGQTEGRRSAEDTVKAEAAYKIRNDAYFDTMDFGTNFISLEGRLITLNTEKRQSIYLIAKHYFSDDPNGVFWGKYANKVDIDDFDTYGVTWVYSPANNKNEVSTSITTGSAFKHSSADVEWLVDGDAILPIYVRYHYGPLDTLSNYTQTKSSLSIGLRFKP